MPTIARRFVLLGIAALSLAACGFEPLMGRTGVSTGVVETLAAIRIDPIADRSGQVLRNELLDQLTPQGAVVAARYVLVVRLQEPRQTLLLRRDDIISRSSYSAQASYILRDMQGNPVFTGSSSFTTDYEITSSEYATRVSLESARDRVMVLVANDIRSQLAQSFKQRDGTAR